MKVILHKLFPYAPYLNEYIGFEDEQGIGETPLEAVERLRKLAEQSHKERYPHLYSQSIETPIQQGSQPIKEINLQAEKVAIQIENAKDKLELSGYAFNADKYGLNELYDNKLKELQK